MYNKIKKAFKFLYKGLLIIYLTAIFGIIAPSTSNELYFKKEALYKSNEFFLCVMDNCKKQGEFTITKLEEKMKNIN